MQGVYRLTGTIANVTTAQSLAWIATHATKPIEIFSARVSCEDEDTSEQIYVELNRIATVGSMAGTTDVPKQTEEGSSNYGGVCKVNMTVEPTGYDDITDAICAGGANKLGSWEYVPMPEERVIIAPADDVALRLVDAIANASGISYEITFREIG